MRRVRGVIVGLLLVGCGDEPSSRTTVPSVDCTKLAVPRWSELAISYCVPCHASSVNGAARKNAPPGTNFDSAASARPFAAGIATRVNAGQMPPPGNPQPTQAQEDALIAWAVCGTPE